MKTFLAAATFICLTVLSAFGQKVSGDSAEFKALTDRYYTAWSSLNPDNAAPMYAKDADLVFYDIAPLKYTGWSEYDKGVRNVFSGFESLKLTPNNDLKVSRHGNIAWTTATVHLSAKQKGGGPIELECRHTAIWEKRASQWLIVHEHFSTQLAQ